MRGPSAKSAEGLTPPMLADLRETPLYKEAESLFRELLKPGRGRPTGASDATVSPDGRRIAFSGTMLDKLEGAPTTRTCLADFETGDLRVVSFGPNTDASPRFSPDGRQLAFRSDRSSPGNFQAYFLDLETGATQAAPEVAGWVEYLEFSPDGRHLLLGVAGHGADVAGAQGAKTSKKADASAKPDWLPTVENGDEGFRRRSVWILDLRSAALRRATPAELNPWEACWCGNDAIAAVVTKGASEEDWYRAHLVSIELATGKATVLYEPKDQLGWLAGAPDGRRLAIVEAVCSDRCVCAGNLLIVDTGRGAVRSIDTRRVDVTWTAWRSSKRLLIAGIRDLETVVADVDAASGAVEERWHSEELHSENPFYPQAAPCPNRGETIEP